MERMGKINCIKILLLVLLFVGLNFLIPSSSYAVVWDWSDFTSRTDLYCVRHSLGFASDGQEYEFTVVKKVKIRGKTGKVYDSSGELLETRRF